MVLRDIFDREFRKRYRGVLFLRFINEVFITIKDNEKVLFDDKIANELLQELNLVGKIESIGPDDVPLRCYKKILFLDDDGYVHVCDPEDYY